MCNAPITLRPDSEGVVRTVPCGHCQACARRRTTSWTLRCLLEKTAHTSTDFITLTYSPECCPDLLHKEHLQLFFKRLRKNIPGRVRYFSCGEYGGRTNRPHWHVLLFGHRLQKRGLTNVSEWPYGHVWTGDLERASAQYVCRYALKSSSSGDNFIAMMSRRPGIGMDQLRFTARHAAKYIPTMEYYPPVMRYQGRSWWLDRHAYAACVGAYTDAGGHLTYEQVPCEDQLDLRAPRSIAVDAAARDYMRRIHGKA